MSTKLSYWLSNKDKTSKKSAGCMSAIFQLFDRQFLIHPRQLNGHYHKQSSSADATISLCKQGSDYREFCNLDSRSSMESSTRTSFSSSPPSFSSLKHRLSKEEPKSSEQSFSSGRSPKNSAKARSTDINQSTSIRESIKESTYKDLRSVSVKDKTKEEVKRNKVLKPVDSPRPIDLSKMKDLEESLRILIQLRELPKNFNEAGGSPRFSYDGRVSTDIKQAMTQKEKGRLSLDSMEDSLRCDFKSKVNSLMKELEKKTNYRTSEASTLHQDLKRNENHTNIVAKLMGLGPISSGRESCVKGQAPVSKQKKQECKKGKLLQSKSSINPLMKSNSNSRLGAEEAQQKMADEYVEGNMKQKIESVYNVIENTLQKLEFHHNSKEIRDLRRAILETKNSAKCLSLTGKMEKLSVSERAFKSPVMVRKPASKSAGISSSQCARLEGPSGGLRKIKTSDSSDRKKEPLSTDGGQTPTGKTANTLNSSAKETSGRAGDNSVSPRLQKRKPDQEIKSCIVIPSSDLKSSQRQPDNRQQAESVSPSSRIRQKSSKAQPNQGESRLFLQTKGKRATNAASDSKHKLHQMIERKVPFVEELEKASPQLSSPNSVLDASPYQDDLPLSPLSVSSISNAEDENLPSAVSLKIIHLPQNLPSTLSFKKDSQKQENIYTKAFIFPGSTADNNASDNKYVAEVLLSSGLLTKDLHMPAILKQIKLVEPFEAVEKNNAQILHKQLVHDVVNEILTRKIMAFNSGCHHDHLLKPNILSFQLLFKELCFEVKYLQSSIDGSFQGKDSVFTKDLLRRSNAWDRFDSEIPVVVLEIERLIFVDLINEILGSLINVVMETKQRYIRQLFV